MKRIIIYSLLLVGCGQTKQQDNSRVSSIQDEVDSIEQQKIESHRIVPSDTSPKPTIHFLKFTNYLDSMGYISDTSRAKKPKII
ncbi:MAG: hypothetical protein IPJ66_14260 [Bacteroidetes bacterium]|nr:hypothetical protein [Bacteroidota bacterium]